jgi:acetyl esterase/lipase
MSRFAGLLITVGVGAAVLSSQAAAEAKPADSSSDPSSAGLSADASGAGPATGDSPGRTKTPTATPAEPSIPDLSASTPPRHKPNGRSRADKKATTPPARKTTHISRTTSEDSAPSKGDDADLKSEAAPIADDAPVASVSAAKPRTHQQISPRADSDPVDPAKPAAVSTDVVGLVTGALSPSAADDAPEAPAGAPAAWSLLAFARREFETALAPRSVTDAKVSLPTTSQARVVDPSATEPATDLQAQTVQNSLTYTGPPNLIDKLIVSGLRVARDVFHFFGLDFGGIVGTLLSSQDPPFFLAFGLDARKTQYEISPGNVWKVWTFTPPDPTDKTVIAIHGGASILEPNIEHWIDYTQMARNTGATVVVPIYPLATGPEGAILKVQPVMADFISQQIDKYGVENVSIYADSGGVTLAFGAVRDLILRGDPVPASMVLLSGQANYSANYNPDIYLIDDPFFDINHLEFYVDNSHAWDGITDGEDPRISPLFMETEVLQALPPTTMYVGGVEFLLPDNLLLHQRAVDIGAPISMVVGAGLPHDWPLGGLPIYSKTAVVRRDIYRQLGLLT